MCVILYKNDPEPQSPAPNPDVPEVWCDGGEGKQSGGVGSRSDEIVSAPADTEHRSTTKPRAPH